MIYGIIASESHQTLSAGPVALGSFDFVTGLYSWGETSLTASQVTDKTAWIGASGLAVPDSDPAGAAILYSAATTVLAACSWTVLLEVQIVTDLTPRAYLLTVSNSGGAYYIEINFSNEWEADASDGVGSPFAYDDAHGVSLGVHKIAVTRIDNRIALSVDGNAVVQATTACALPKPGYPMTNFYLGGWPDYTGHAVNIRSLSIYDVQPDEVLITL